MLHLDHFVSKIKKMNHENRVLKSSVFLKMFYQKVQVYFHTVACTFQIELVHDPSLDDLALPAEDKINKFIGQTSTLLPAAAASILPKF